jgi:predicted RNase H-like nuclease (RuvC/YqgF family)
MNELISIILGALVPAAISAYTLWQSKKNRQAEQKKVEAETDTLEQGITERVLKIADGKLKEYECDIQELKKLVKAQQIEIDKLCKDIGIYKRNQVRLIKTIKTLLNQMKEEGITPVVAFDLTELEEID